MTGVACVGAGYALVGSGILTPGFVFGHAWSSGRRFARSTAEHTAARGFTFIRRGLVRCGLPGLILIGRYGRSTSLFLIRAGRTGLGVSCAAYAYSAAKQHDCKKPVHKASLQLDATLRHCSASDLQSTANKKAAPQRRQRAKPRTALVRNGESHHSAVGQPVTGSKHGDAVSPKRSFDPA